MYLIVTLTPCSVPDITIVRHIEQRKNGSIKKDCTVIIMVSYTVYSDLKINLKKKTTTKKTTASYKYRKGY